MNNIFSKRKKNISRPKEREMKMIPNNILYKLKQINFTIFSLKKKLCLFTFVLYNVLYNNSTIIYF